MLVFWLRLLFASSGDVSSIMCLKFFIPLLDKGMK
jgi:hypothetical protein